MSELFIYGVDTITMRNHVCRNHITLKLKLKKQIIFHIQLLCNYPLRNMIYW
jgi:hypothetical protein